MENSKECKEGMREPPAKMTRERKERRQRTKFSPTQLYYLEQSFKQHPYIKSEDASLLADQLGITTLNTMVWFRNRRKKSKRIQVELTRMAVRSSRTDIQQANCSLPYCSSHAQIPVSSGVIMTSIVSPCYNQVVTNQISPYVMAESHAPVILYSGPGNTSYCMCENQ